MNVSRYIFVRTPADETTINFYRNTKLCINSGWLLVTVAIFASLLIKLEKWFLASCIASFINLAPSPLAVRAPPRELMSACGLVAAIDLRSDRENYVMANG